ncbi:MAG: RNA polymerase subunit sigma-70 [Planctomycetaceae bacterium]|nr:RNA polymerase subunit sigma-70 [Planctomycetaceae bacterium]
MATPEGRVTAELSDRSLLRRFRSGEHDAATALYVRYASRLLALANSRTSPSLASRFDPEDVVQSVFRTFFRRAAEGLYEVPPGDELWQLFLVIALNKVRALCVHHRAQKRDVQRTASAAVEDVYSARADEAPMRILKIVVDEYVNQLPDSQQTVIRMRIEGHEINEIAQQTTRSKRTVERVLQRFRHELSELIDGNRTNHKSESPAV